MSRNDGKQRQVPAGIGREAAGLIRPRSTGAGTGTGIPADPGLPEGTEGGTGMRPGKGCIETECCICGAKIILKKCKYIRNLRKNPGYKPACSRRCKSIRLADLKRGFVKEEVVQG